MFEAQVVGSLKLWQGGFLGRRDKELVSDLSQQHGKGWQCLQAVLFRNDFKLFQQILCFALDRKENKLNSIAFLLPPSLTISCSEDEFWHWADKQPGR